jgi:hypothetical protein
MEDNVLFLQSSSCPKILLIGKNKGKNKKILCVQYMPKQIQNPIFSILNTKIHSILLFHTPIPACASPTVKMNRLTNLVIFSDLKKIEHENRNIAYLID